MELLLAERLVPQSMVKVQSMGLVDNLSLRQELNACVDMLTMQSSLLLVFIILVNLKDIFFNIDKDDLVKERENRKFFLT